MDRAGSESFDVEVGNMLLSLDAAPEAAEVYRNILDGSSRSAEVHYNLALAYSRLGKHRAAADAFERAAELGYGGAHLWNNLGLAYRDSGEPGLAETAFRKALSADALHWHAAGNLAKLLDYHGSEAEALRVLEEGRRSARAAGDSSDALDRIERLVVEDN